MAAEHLDVLIVGAGLSGIGAAHHLKTHHPGRSVAILEMRDDLGGTWDLFKYPGIRSDSDMHTLGFGFRPWASTEAIADAPAIMQYLRETAEEDGTVEKIRFGHKVVGAAWSSTDARWTVDVELVHSGELQRLTCDMLLCCSGYYDYDQGYLPQFQGTDRFAGQIVHPQHWPEDLDYAGKRVVVIGSGATAVTLVPAMASQAAHVTMLQRSPTYIASIPRIDGFAERVGKILPERQAYTVVRWKNVLRQTALYQFSQRQPRIMKRILRSLVTKQLPEGYDVQTHFQPSYNPWDQRLCAVPGGDLFKAIRDGHASVVTDHIDTFTERGILLKSGQELEADIVVTATGLNLKLFGGMQLSVDGEPVVLSERMAYKGLMLEGIPNFAFAIGYTNASWTLKADLMGEYVCRLLEHMDRGGYDWCMPQTDDPSIEREPLLDFGAGYVQRSIASLPKQGSKRPWKLRMNYALDLVALRRGELDDGAMRFGRKAPATAGSAPVGEPAAV